MWDLVLFYIGIVSTIILICDIESRPLQDIDLATILKVLNEEQHYSKHSHSHKYQQSLDSSNDIIDNEENSHYGSLKSREILELIEQATHNKDVDNIPFGDEELRNKIRVTPKIHGVKNMDNQINKLKHRDKALVDEPKINQILSYIQSQAKSKKKPKKQAVKHQKLIDNLVHSITQGHEVNGGARVIDDYSKIYIILNPHAIQEKSNKASLSDILSKISSLPSFPKELGKVKKNQPYKGFPVKEGVFSRRARRDSKEKYDLKDSMEDYKQKRSRNDHGSSRTAIPYIRHRGDIYERDN